MAKVRLSDGRTLNFSGTPTQADIEEAVSNIGGKTTSPTMPSSIGDLISGATGVGAVGGLGYGAYRASKPIIRGASYLSRGLRNVPTIRSTEKSAKFASEIQGEQVRAAERQYKRFDRDLKKWQAKDPGRTVNLGEILESAKTNPDIANDVMSAVRKDPRLGFMLDDPKLSRSVTLAESQEIINNLNKNPKVKVNYDLRSIINDIKVAQLEAFPEMEKTRGAYRKFIEPYKATKNYFKFNRVIPSIVSEEPPFGGAQGWEAVKKYLPEKVINKIKDYRAGSRIERIPRKIPFLGRFFGASLAGANAIQQADILKSAYNQEPGIYGTNLLGQAIRPDEESISKMRSLGLLPEEMA